MKLYVDEHPDKTWTWSIWDKFKLVSSGHGTTKKEATERGTTVLQSLKKELKPTSE